MAAGHAERPSASAARGRVTSAVLALLAYALLSATIYGRHVLPHLHHVVEGFGQAPAFYGRDQSFYVWALASAARGLAHGQNLFFTHAVFAPSGYNLAWSASVPGPGLLLAPITLLLGAVASFDLLAIAAPAAAAWTAYLLCRHLSGRTGAAFAGGLLFGFGTYETAEMVNHLSLALVALIPLAVLIVIRRYAGLTSRRRFVAALAVVLALQLWTATEVFASLTVFGVLAFALALVLCDREERSRIYRCALETLAGFGGAVVLASPLLYYAFTYPNPVRGITGANGGADLANFVIPTQVTWLHGGAPTLRGNLSEQLAYFGLPLLVVLVAFAIEFRRERLGRYLVVFIVLATVASLGAHAYVGARNTGVPLPWDLVAELPLLRFAVPVRFLVYVWLALAVVLACWLARPSRRALRWACAALVAATVAPNLTGVPWATRVDSPPLMRAGSLARYVPAGATVLALPFGIAGNSMYWQVEADFRFRLAGGYVSVSLPGLYLAQRHLITALEGGAPTRHPAAELCSFIRRTGSQVILLREHTPGSWTRLLGTLHVRPEHAGGFAVYELGRSRCLILVTNKSAERRGGHGPRTLGAGSGSVAEGQ
jgi:hypothetical protein